MTDAAASVFGAGRVGVRISPLNSYNDMVDSDPVALTEFVARALGERRIAYLHVMRADFLGRQHGDVLAPARRAFTGALVANMGYTPAEAAQAVSAGAVDAVAFGTSFLANPDLPERIRLGAALNAPDPATFYSPGAKGYNDYPALAESR